MDANLVKALHDQLHREYAASVFYRQVYFWFELNLYPGTAAYFKVSIL
jgi:ferritin